jgi:hypothetical protein
VNVVITGNEINIAGGTYYGPAGGTVAVIAGKELVIRGGYDSSCTIHDPGLYETVLDAQWGGSVISITNAGDVLLHHLTLTGGDGTGNCGTVGCGGGIYATGTTLRVADSVITNNVGSTAGGSKADGGGVYVDGSGHSVEIWGTRIVSNVANTDPSATYYSYGGGIFIRYGDVSLRDNEVLSNVGSTAGTGGYGGGIFLYDVAPAEVLTNTLRGNEASRGSSAGSGSGGGLSLFAGNVYIAGNRIENNWTNPDFAGYGGGVCVWNGNAHLSRNTIISNASVPEGGGFMAPGGGVYVDSSEPVTLTANLIVSNTASGGGGGGVYAASYSSPATPVLLINNTIADNGNSGIVVWQYADLTLINNIVAGHAVGIDNTSPASSTVSADTNLFWNSSDPITGTNAILQDPLLAADYHLSNDSPALDAGLTIPWLTVDLDGTSRPQRNAYDLGAFEEPWFVYLPLVLRGYP